MSPSRDVLAELEARMGTSGLEEKAARGKRRSTMNQLDSPGRRRSPAVADPRSQLQFSPYRVFTREEWAKLRADTPMTLVPRDLEQLSGLIEELSMEEVEQIYLPMSRLLNLHVAGAQELHAVTSRFLGRTRQQRALTSSASAARSPSARAPPRACCKALLARWPDHPRVD